ncbi:guanylate cyclase [Bradyrhizobium sp. Y36]|uniref:adenylate/guanylate cyclase domain-containing protein n=1 Tax=Bradyrhizobium sp. Y36 TaxID=2035447 RepID=UPI000BE7B8A7|nr:adenylate/guanylate cyclase domain-containing protein [Bradyrhizobium sp. Y36]PDT92019.1 guanylate cyclase [Bradyrhizobium sp. Y36]
MTDDKVKRRLTTVLCADVYGYSRLMEADEAGTLETLRRYRTAIARLVERHDGRIVNTWGDAVIAEFASVVEAVQCAVEIQQEISSQAADTPQANPMRFRIGINLGDVMVDGTDIYGDGVNIASRLQELAEPGGVVISSSVYDQVHNKLSVGFDCLGQRPMKNIAPLTSYRLTLGSQVAGPASYASGESAAPFERAHAPRMNDRRAPSPPTNVVSDWLARVPRPVAAALTVCAFLILINLFTSHKIWFHWPVAAILFGVVLRMVLGQRPETDSRPER